jgi:endonuclease G
VHTIVKIDYGGTAGECSIGGFEIGPDEANLPGNGEISMGGDSGSAWMLKAANSKPSKIMAGLHFAGETAASASEYAVACYAKSVFEKLEITFTPPTVAEAEQGTGYATNFLGPVVNLPKLSRANNNDAFQLNGTALLHYTHFTLALSQTRRLAFFVAWNIDGSRIKRISSNGLQFKTDPRVPAKFQVGDEVYSGNRLDRGHLARRADLTWGGDVEAKKANVDSFFFTNIAPQMDHFNQSSAGGIWGKLEDAVFEEVDVDNIRVSMFGGPVFQKDDRLFRGVKIPREFFKVLVYIEAGKLKAKAFLLTQNLSQLELLDLSQFKVYQVGLAEVEKRCGFTFPSNLKPADIFTAKLETLSEEERPPLKGLDEIKW